MSTSTPAIAAKSIRLRQNRCAQYLLESIAQELQAGALVVFPTETVYGLGTSAFSPSGIRRIYAVKGRTWQKPLALLTPSLDAARPLLEHIPSEAARLAEHFWPGPLTLVFQASTLGRLITEGRETVGVRVPDHPFALALLQCVGLPLATTSANASGEEPAISGRKAAQLFRKKVEWVVDGGACPVEIASSVVDCSHYPPTVLREGAISKKKLEAVLFSPDAAHRPPKP